MFGWYDLKVEEGVEEINDMDKLLLSCDENEVEDLVGRRSKVIFSMWRNLSIKDNMLIQVARVKWNRDGDLKTNYLHNLVKGRAMRKFIGVINTERGRVESVDDVKEAIRDFFNKDYIEPGLVRPLLEGLSFRTLN